MGHFFSLVFEAYRGDLEMFLLKDNYALECSNTAYFLGILNFFILRYSVLRAI